MEYRLHRTSSQASEIKERNISSSKHHVTEDEPPFSLPRALSLPINTQTTVPKKSSQIKEIGGGGGNIMETRGRFAVTPGNFKLRPTMPTSSSRRSSTSHNSISRSSSEIPWTMLVIPQMEKMLQSSMAQHDQLITIIRDVDPHFNYDCKSLTSRLRTTKIRESGSAREYELLRTIANLQVKVASLTNEVQNWRSKNSRLENQLYALQSTSRVGVDN